MARGATPQLLMLPGNDASPANTSPRDAFRGSRRFVNSK